MSYAVHLALKNEEVLDFLKVEANTPTKYAIQLMANFDKDYVVVVENNKAVGIFSESDVLKLKYANENLDKNVLEYASKPAITVRSSFNLFEAINLMIENDISKLIIVDDEDKPIGVLTQRTLIKTIDQEMLKRNKNVKDILRQRDLISLSPTDTLSLALKTLVENKIRAVVILEPNNTNSSEFGENEQDTNNSRVVSRGRLVGIITQKDLTKLISVGVDLDKALIKDYMKSPVITCRIDTPLIEASKIMASFNIRRLVVVDEKDNPIGIVTQGDIIRNLEEKYEEYVEKKLKHLRSMLNIMQDPVLEVMDAGVFDSSSGIIIWQNDSAKSIFGNFLGKNIEEIIDHYTWKYIYEKLKNEKSVNYEPIFIKDYIYHISCLYIEDEQKIIDGRIKILFKDITKAYKSELELKKINKQYKNILDAMNDMVIIYDAYDYKIKFVNKSTLEHLGYTEEELTNKNFFDIILNSENVIKHFIERVIKENKKVVGRRVYIKKNGEFLPVHVVATKVEFENNTGKEHILVVARDISKELIIEEKLKNTNKDLNMLYSFITDLSKAHQEDEAYDILIHYLKRLGIEYIHMYKLNPSLNKIVSSYLLNTKSIYQPHDESNVWVNDCLEDNPSLCKVIKSGTTLATPNINADYGCPRIALGSSIKSYMCVPIFIGGVYITNATAILTLMSSKENFFTEGIKNKINKFIEAFIPVVSNLRLMEINKELSIRDPLTNAYNRRFLDEILEKEFQKAIRYQTKLSIIMLDVDNFKKFNDTYGHRAGDMALQHLSKVVQENIRVSDIFARYGGEEFMIVLPETPKEYAIEIANRVKDTLSSKMFYINSLESKDISTLDIDDIYPKYYITASFGVATFDDDAKNLEELIKVADMRLYKAKELGKNRVVYN
jgi:diguanylate cyclase (GGDEF)-like protein/PAS domain S-box-containing protein